MPQHVKIYTWLLPIARLYEAVVWVRNWLYDHQVLHSKRFPAPVISVGNLAVGGTGKTPHTEYLIRLLSPLFRVAVLSRGYKRKSKGFILADGATTVETLGDEPYQMKHKFPDIRVAVDANRCNGITRLLSSEVSPSVEAIILDDAFQHRAVKPGMSILLVDYHRLFTHDRLLPAGLLREPAENKVRANLIIVTKCPADLKPMGFRILRDYISPYPFQSLFFTSFRYGTPFALFGNSICRLDEVDTALLLTGIASPTPLRREVKRHVKNVVPLTFGDHHQFTPEDVLRINTIFSRLEGKRRILLTTEKDAARLQALKGLDEAIRQATYVMPIEVVFLQDGKEEFDNTIIDYVRKDSRNSHLA